MIIARNAQTQQEVIHVALVQVVMRTKVAIVSSWTPVPPIAIDVTVARNAFLRADLFTVVR